MRAGLPDLDGQVTLFDGENECARPPDPPVCPAPARRAVRDRPADKAGGQAKAERDRVPERESRCGICVKDMSHRCRALGKKECGDFEEYTGSTVRQCLLATVEIFQDGYIHCPLVGCYGCEYCFEETGGEPPDYERSQNYEKRPYWKDGRMGIETRDLALDAQTARA